MNAVNIIDEIFDIINDPRNISPDQFAKFYPIPGNKWNPNNLYPAELNNHFEVLQKFKKPIGYKGYRPLESKVVQLILKVQGMGYKKIQDTIVYFVSRAKNAHSFVFDYTLTDGLLTENERHELLGAYTVFFGNIKKVLLDEINEILIGKNKAENDLPDWFKTLESFSIFNSYVKKIDHKYIDEVRNDHAFIYQTLLKNKLIHKPINQNSWIQWLYDADYISIEEKDEMHEKQFRAYSKVNSKLRLTKYSDIKDSHL